MYFVKKVILNLPILLISFCAQAQNVGIGTTTPNANAILDVSSTNKGLLLPRLIDTNAVTGVKPAGLMIYSNADKHIYFFNGSYWQKSDLWYIKNDSVNYTNSKYVGINTDLNLLPPQANLQINGSILSQQSTIQSSAAPTAAQTSTMNNTISNQIVGTGGDSVLRIFDPGGSNNNYTNNMQGNILLPYYSNELGYQVSFNAADFGLGTGDTLWFSIIGNFSATRTNYLFRFTNTVTAPADILISTSGIFVYFRSNSDGNNNKGFDISFRKIFAGPSKSPALSAVGTAFYFNPSKGALQSGLTAVGTPGKWSAALGELSSALGQGSFATGWQSMASGGYSTAMGSSTNATGYSSTAMGGSTKATAYFSTAMGDQTTASGSSSTAMGSKTTASGDISAAIGRGTVAKAYSSLSLGQYNDSINTSNKTSWVETDPLLILGNGASDAARSNALVVYKSGNTDINGYTQLGKASEGAPGIKTKKIIGYNTPTSTNPYTFTYVPHGLVASKILSISVLINASGNYEIMPQSTQAGYTYSVNTDPTGGGQANIAVGVKSAAESSSVMGRPIKIFITYEE